MPAANEQHPPSLVHAAFALCHPDLIGVILSTAKDLPGRLLRRLFLFLALITPSIAAAQHWSEPARPANLPEVQVQWRVCGTDAKSKKNIIEWVFSNTADTAIAFNYRIETDRGETRMGRIEFKPRKKQMSGWLFAGDSLVRIEVDRRPFGVTN